MPSSQNNARPMLRNIKCWELIQGIQPAGWRTVLTKFRLAGQHWGINLSLALMKNQRGEIASAFGLGIIALALMPSRARRRWIPHQSGSRERLPSGSSNDPVAEVLD